ncbi:19468_t:CDS:1, partial [Dentiscutata erythropus]
MGLVIGLMDKGLLLPEAIEQVLAKAEEKKRTSLNKNLYYFINKEEHEFK